MPAPPVSRGPLATWASGGAVLLLLASTSVAAAQIGREVPGRLETLAPVVVTATRTPVELKHVAASVTVITREEIEARHATDVVDLLRQVPGVTIASGSRGTVAIAQARGGSDVSTLILIDGVKVNDSNAFFTLAGLSTDNVERIEIVRGPQSSLYGADAVTAVIQIFTRKGSGGAPRADLSSGAGNLRTFEESLGLAGGWGRLAYSLGVGRVDADGSLPINSGVHSTTVSNRLDWGLKDIVDVTATARFSQSRSDVPANGPDRFEILDPHQSFDQERLVLGARMRHHLTSWWEHTLQFGFQRYRFDISDPLDRGVDFSGLFSTSEEHRYAVDYIWNVSLPRVHDVSTLITVGAAYEAETFDLTARFTDIPQPFTNSVHSHRDVGAGHVQAQWDWKKQAFATTGVRVDQSSVFGTAVSPRASAAYILPSLETKIRTSYGHGIRAPRFVESFGNGSPFLVGNRALRPERSRSWEVGIDQPVAHDRGDVSLTYFRTRFTDEIVTLVGASVTFENLPAVEAQGLELTAALRLDYGVTVTGTYTFLDTDIIDNGGVGETEFPRGAPLIRRPRHSGSVSVDHHWARLDTKLIILVFGDSEDLDPRTFPLSRVSLPAYNRLDGAVSWLVYRDIANGRELTLFGRAANILDRRYEEAFGFSTPGRTFLFGLRGRI